MALKIACCLAAIGIVATATAGNNAVAAGTPDPQHYSIKGDTITFRFGATDQDMASLDAHPDLKTIVIGGDGDGPDPSKVPFKITDAGFAHIANCKKLEKFVANSIHPLQVTDDGLKALEELTELRIVNLCGGHWFSDKGMTHLSGLTNLEELWLDFNVHVSDGAMQAVSNLKKLRVLRFYQAPVIDAGVAHIRGLTELQELQLGGSRVSDAAMETIGTFTKLKLLDLQHTRVTDAGLVRLSSLNLHWLCLNGTPVTGKGLVALTDMTDLQWLFLEGTGADDAFLDSIAHMSKLESADFSGTCITEVGLRKMTRYERLETLRLNQLPLTDTVIPWLAEMKALKQFEMNGTKVTEAGFKRLHDAGVERWNHQN